MRAVGQVASGVTPLGCPSCGSRALRERGVVPYEEEMRVVRIPAAAEPERTYLGGGTRSFRWEDTDVVAIECVGCGLVVGSSLDDLEELPAAPLTRRPKEEGR